MKILFASLIQGLACSCFWLVPVIKWRQEAGDHDYGMPDSRVNGNAYLCFLWIDFFVELVNDVHSLALGNSTSTVEGVQLLVLFL